MFFKLIDDTNTDIARDVIYNVAHLVCVETAAVSLRAVEALTSMIANNAIATKRTIADVIADKDLFDSLKSSSKKREPLGNDINNRGFKMCLRVAIRMVHGNLPDACFGATKFHHASVLPDWAIARGYIYETDDFLFYS